MRKNSPADYHSKVDRRGPDECWPWQGSLKTGRYGQFKINGETHQPSRFGWELRFGPIPPGMCVCHSCDNPPCQNPAHWFLGTHQDNMADMMAKGRHRPSIGDRNGTRLHPEKLPRGTDHWSKRHPERILRGDNHPARLHPERLARGERHALARLTAADVREIIALDGKIPRVEIAKRKGVSYQTVYLILKGRAWRHVTEGILEPRDRSSSPDRSPRRSGR